MVVGGGRTFRFGAGAPQIMTNTPELLEGAFSTNNGEFAGHAWTAIGKSLWVDTTLGNDARVSVEDADKMDGLKTVPDVWPFPDVHIQQQVQRSPKKQYNNIIQGFGVAVGYNRDPNLTTLVRKDILEDFGRSLARRIGENHRVEVSS